jgi:protoheme IX farnesyltransferase
MLPVVRGPSATTVRVLAYSGALVVATVLPGVVGVFGGLYLGAAILLDAVLCVLAWRLWREGTPARAGALFHWSLLYLALLFVAVAVDAAIG